MYSWAVLAYINLIYRDSYNMHLLNSLKFKKVENKQEIFIVVAL